jgi:hypothetical protein
MLRVHSSANAIAIAATRLPDSYSGQGPSRKIGVGKISWTVGSKIAQIALKIRGEHTDPTRRD